MSTLREQLRQQMQLKGYSSRTVETYTEAIACLSKFYNTSPDVLSIEQVRHYIHYQLTEKKLSKSWMNQVVSALKILYIEVLKREWNDLDIPRPRRERRLPVVLSKQEISQLITRTENIKHKAILTIIYSAGLRLGETQKLRIGDIDSSRMMIRIVQAKGFKDRYAPLSVVALEALRIYWKRYHPKVWLFETKSGTFLPERTIQHVFKAAMLRSGNKKKTGIHSLRHSFATHLLEQGTSLPILQQLLGHRSLRTTNLYLHVQQYSIDAVKSPLDSLSL